MDQSRKPPNAAIYGQVAEYARISDDREGRQLGTLRQLKLCRRVAIDDLALGPDQVLEPYVDPDVSAFSGKRREQFERLIADVEAGKVNTIICYDLDRLTRRPSEIERLTELAEEVGLRLITVVSGEIDLLDEDAEMFAAIKGSMGRRESKRIKRRIKAKHDEMAEEGLSKGQPRAFGFLPAYEMRDGRRVWVRRGHSELDEAEAALIREAADRLLFGEAENTLLSITEDWNTRGIKPARAAGLWSPTVLRRILLRPEIAGLRVHRGQIMVDGRGEEVRAQWPAILDRETWESLREKLLDPARRTSPGNRVKYLLSHIGRCGKCGGPLSGFKDKVDDRYEYLCQARRHVVVSMRGLDSFVVARTIGWLNDPQIRSLLKYGNPRAGEQARELATQIGQQEALRRRRVAELADQDDMTLEDLRPALQKIDNRLKGLREELAAITKERQNTAALDGLPEELTPELWAGLSLLRRRALVRLACVSVVVHSTKVRGRRFDTDRVKFGRPSA